MPDTSGFGFMASPLIWGPLLFLALIFGVLRIFVKNYIKVPPDEIAVFTGRGTPKVVRGGARLRIPGLERVDTMTLRPFNVNIKLTGVPSGEKVNVNVEAVGLVRIGSSDEAALTAIERFLTSNMDDLHRQINDILGGSLRGIVATMTVEELNGNREELARRVVSEAGSDLERIGMAVDVLKIQNISDNDGYLEALGRTRIAQVRRDADIAEAEATRDSQIRSAKARQDGSVAEAASSTAIAEAQQSLQLRQAQLDAQVEAEQARQRQAGPLADAEARKAVVTAEQAAEAARVRARTEVEELRSAEQAKRLEADTIAPAEAERAAAVLRAEGERQAAILRAQAEAEAVRQRGDAEAHARTVAATASQAEQLAAAEGLKAKLLAEAEGQREMAEALNAFTTGAAQLHMLPETLRAFVEAVQAASAPLSNIDSISIIGGGSGNDNQGLLGGVLGITPDNIAATLQVLKASGIDVSAMLNTMGNTAVVETPAIITATPSTSTE